VKLRTLLTTSRSPSILAVTLRATSGIQFRSFDGVIVLHHARTGPNKAAKAIRANHRFGVARHATAKKARTTIAPAKAPRTGSLAVKRNQIASTHQPPISSTAVARREKPIQRASHLRIIRCAPRAASRLLPVSLRGLDCPTDREHVLAAPRRLRGAWGCTALREGLRHKVHVRYLYSGNWRLYAPADPLWRQFLLPLPWPTASMIAPIFLATRGNNLATIYIVGR
jgi:hypothetical protein